MTVNLASSLRDQGHEVGVIDADIYGFSIPGMLGVTQRPVIVDKMIVPPVALRREGVSIGFFMDEGGAVMWRGPMLHKALEQFLSDVHWGQLDYLLSTCRRAPATSRSGWRSCCRAPRRSW